MRLHLRARSLALLVSLCAPVAACLQAQNSAAQDGVLVGTVVEPNGAPLHKAHIRLLQQTDTGDLDVLAGADASALHEPSTVRVATDTHGRFAMLQLQPGVYRVAIDTADGASFDGGLVQVDALEPAVVHVCACRPLLTTHPGNGNAPDAERAELADMLQATPPGSTAATLEVGEPPELRVASSPGDNADTPQEDEEHGTGSAAPPAVFPDRIEAPGATQQLASGEERAAENAGSRTNSTGGSGVRRSTFSRSAVSALRVFPRSYSVAAGTNLDVGGGSLLLHPGSNSIHGGGFATLRLSAFDAANPYAVVTHFRDGVISSSIVKPTDTDVQAGAHVSLAPFARLPGAGSWREHVFAAAAMEARIRTAPVESTPATPGFYALTAMQQALLQNRGVRAAQSVAALDFLDSLSGEIPRSNTQLLTQARVDLHGSARDALAITFAGDRLRSPAGAAFDQLADAVIAHGRGSVGDQSVDVQAYAAQWAHQFRPRLANTLQVQFVRDREAETPREPLSQEPNISPSGQAPEVEIAPEGFAYGTPAELDRTAYPDEHRVGASDTVHWAVRLHVLTFGGEWVRSSDQVNSLRNANGTFLYESDDTRGRAGGLVDWITDATFNVHAYPNGGCPSITATVHDFCFRTYTQSFGAAQTNFATHEFTGFAEDAFAARHDLRITAGARYEYTLLPLPQVPNTGLDASLRAVALPGELAGTTNGYPEDRNNIGARLALAWSPHAGRWFTLRAGIGEFFGQLAGTTLRAALADNGLASGIAQVRITPATETLCPQVANQGFGYPCAFTTGTPPAAVAQTSSVALFASRFRLPAVERGSVQLERLFGSHVALELTYTGAVATQLPTSVDINIAPTASVARFSLQGGESEPQLRNGRSFVLPLYTARRLATYGPITAITSQANATYHAGTVTALLRSWHGVDARAGLTFSRALDDNPESGSAPRVNGSFDPFAIGYDKGLSDTQSPVRFAGLLVLHPTLHRGARALRATVDGWRVEAVATASSGLPYSYEIFGGTRLNGGHTSINGSGGATFLPTIGRNTLRLPARANVNLRLERGGTLRGLRVSGFAEAFNLFNERDLSRVETRAFLPGTAVNGVTPLVFQDAATIAAEGITTPAFGTATSSTSNGSRERVLTLGMRVAF